MLDVFAILVGLLAILQFFIKTDNWTIPRKLLTCLILLVLSVSLFLLKDSYGSITDDKGFESSPANKATQPGNLESIVTEIPISTEDPTERIQFNPAAEPASDATSEPEKTVDCRLSDANIVDHENVVVTDQRFVNDSFGNGYRQVAFFDYDYASGYVIFSTLGNYAGFKGVIAIYQYASSNNAHEIEVFADDNSIYYITIKKTDEPIQFSLDITGARLIKIVADGDIIIGDGVFYN